jgi:predicted glycogen debranching enzyme
MSYISFNQAQLNNLTFSSEREIIRTNRAGAYMSTTLSGCNTRKYHGLLIVPIDTFGNEKHVLLSQLDETIIQRNTPFDLIVRRYANDYYDPQGSKYLNHFEYEKVPGFTFKAGSVKLVKERLLVEKEQQILIRYTLVEANSPVKLQLRPFVAFRNIHNLSKSNAFARSDYEEANNGIRVCLYEGYPWLYMQLNKEVVFKPAPDWFFNVEYEKEKNRGYECLEDLFSPGIFEVEIKVGESIVFSASTFESGPKTLKTKFANEHRKRKSQNSFIESLNNAANQFIWHQGKDVDIIAGFPWYNSISRQTFISLPGLRLTQADRGLGMAVLDTYLPFLKGGLFPRSITGKEPVYDSADASLWFIWTIQQLRKQGRSLKELGIRYGKAIKEILEAYRSGTHIVNMLENGLLFAADEGFAYTWMDSYADGNPVVPRYGMPVELNALWYNATKFAIEMANHAGDSDFVAEWKFLPEKIEESFLAAYWNEEKGYLADVYNGFYTDWSIRPNMVIAAAMDYTPLSRHQQRRIVDVATHHLVTPRGLRTLTPDDPAFRGEVNGSVAQREAAVHTGAAHPWLLQFYAEGYLRLHKKSGVAHIKHLIDGFSDEMTRHCLGTISEMYNGNPPHTAKGAVSQAWNVAALLYCINLVAQTEKE